MRLQRQSGWFWRVYVAHEFILRLLIVLRLQQSLFLK